MDPQQSPPRKYYCLYPCRKSFPTEYQLTQHYKLAKACNVRWEQKQSDTLKTFELMREQNRARRRARMIANELGDSGDDHDIVDHGDVPESSTQPSNLTLDPAESQSPTDNAPLAIVSTLNVTSQPHETTSPISPATRTLPHTPHSPSFDHNMFEAEMELQAAEEPTSISHNPLDVAAPSPFAEDAPSIEHHLLGVVPEPHNEETAAALYDTTEDATEGPPVAEATLALLPNLPYFGVADLGDDDESEGGGDTELEAALFENEDEPGGEEPFNPLLEEYDGRSDVDGSSVEENDDDEPLQAPALDTDVGQPNHDQVEEPFEDEDEDPSDVELFPGAGDVKAKVPSRYAQLANTGLGRPSGLFYPFKDAAEFEMVEWLNQLPASRVDEFLKLKYTQRHNDITFGSAKTMREWIKKMVQPRMKWKNILVTPRHGRTSSEVYLMYRSPLATIASLLDRPALAEHMTYQPRRCWRDKATGQRRYSEIFTGEWAWKTQTSLPNGSTLLPVLLGSDKAHLTEFSGNKSAWPLYLSLGNINSRVCNKPSSRCWILIAYIPIPVWTGPKNLHGPLQSRLFHQCLDIVLQELVSAGKQGLNLVDSLGDVRHCYPRLSAYLADYPEQILINVVAQYNSPFTTAGFADLGNRNPHPRRTRQWILSQIARAKAQADPNDVGAYMAAARSFGLNAVHKPFWHKFEDYQPDLVLAPDILHGLFRFWRDHLLQWVIHLVGDTEFDNRLKTLQPIVGIRHFSDGIKHLSQWSGREDRELQRVLVAVVAGHPNIDERVMRALRAFHDFLYLAQYRSHSTKTLGYLEASLRMFHASKSVFIANGARRGKKGVITHFSIPKLSALHQFVYHVPHMGTSMQFSTEITENCHQTNAKRAYKSTNRKDFFKQMCYYLNRQDTLSTVREISVWYVNSSRVPNTLVSNEDLSQFIQKIKQSAERQERLEIRRENRARSGYIWQTVRPDRSNLSIDVFSRLYRISEFRHDLLQFLARSPSETGTFIGTLKINVWYRCRMQRPTIQDDDELADARTILAEPPNTHQNYGHCNCVLVFPDEDEDVNAEVERSPTGIAGYRVAQLHAIFTLQVSPNHPFYNVPLAYVFWFQDIPDRTERNINMYKISYSRGFGNHRTGSIIQLVQIQRLVQLIPVFGRKHSSQFCSKNSMDIAKEYYINSFLDKETYQAVW